MPYKSKADKREYDRQYRKKRAENEKNTSQPKELDEAEIEKLTTAAGQIRLIAKLLHQLDTSEYDLIMKARVISSLVSSCTRLYETVEMEQRLEEIEKYLTEYKERENSEKQKRYASRW